MPAEPQAVTLPDGRSLSYTDIGDPAGKPVLLFHGTPACSASFDPLDGPASAAGIRAIAPDRPGIRLSDFQRKRRLVDWPDDVGALAEALRLERFAVLGWSGGGPYALACAARIPDRVVACGVAAGVAPTEMPGAIAGLAQNDRRLTLMAARTPLTARLTLAGMGWMARRSPERAREAFESELAEIDVATVRRHWPGELTLFTEVFRRGARGVTLDYALSARRWGFPLDEVAVPVQIWHGDADRSVPLDQGRWLADHLPDATLEVVAGGGHFLVLDRAAELLAAVA